MGATKVTVQISAGGRQTSFTVYPETGRTKSARTRPRPKRAAAKRSAPPKSTTGMAHPFGYDEEE